METPHRFLNKDQGSKWSDNLNCCSVTHYHYQFRQQTSNTAIAVLSENIIHGGPRPAPLIQGSVLVQAKPVFYRLAIHTPTTTKLLNTNLGKASFSPPPLKYRDSEGIPWTSTKPTIGSRAHSTEQAPVISSDPGVCSRSSGGNKHLRGEEGGDPSEDPHVERNWRWSRF